MKVARLEEIEPIAVVGGELQWRPVRRTLGIEAFGINAYTADAGALVVEEHDETGAGAGHHEELYVVVTGHATFTVDGRTVDAPVGTCVFLDDPKERRGALAVEDGTTVLAIGSLLYELACVEALMGERDHALAHLAQAAANPRMREYAREDTDLDSLRDDPRFNDALESRQEASS
jgi:hypothetical protein